MFLTESRVIPEHTSSSCSSKSEAIASDLLEQLEDVCLDEETNEKIIKNLNNQNQ